MTLASPLKTVLGRNGSIIRKMMGSGGRFEKVRANGTDIFITAFVTRTGETDPDVDLCAKGEHCDGIIYGPWSGDVDLDKDSDDCYDDNTWLMMYVPVNGDEIYFTAKTNSAIGKGDLVQVDGGFGIAFAYADGTEATDTLQSVVGTCQDAVTAAASTEKVTWLIWGGN